MNKTVSRHDATSHNPYYATLIPPPKRIKELKELHINAFEDCGGFVPEGHRGGAYTPTPSNKVKFQALPSRRIFSKASYIRWFPAIKDDFIPGFRLLFMPKVKNKLNKVFLSHNHRFPPLTILKLWLGKITNLCKISLNNTLLNCPTNSCTLLCLELNPFLYP